MYWAYELCDPRQTLTLFKPLIPRQEHFQSLPESIILGKTIYRKASVCFQPDTVLGSVCGFSPLRSSVFCTERSGDVTHLIHSLRYKYPDTSFIGHSALDYYALLNSVSLNQVFNSCCLEPFRVFFLPFLPVLLLPHPTHVCVLSGSRACVGCDYARFACSISISRLL